MSADCESSSNCSICNNNNDENNNEATANHQTPPAIPAATGNRAPVTYGSNNKASINISPSAAAPTTTDPPPGTLTSHPHAPSSPRVGKEGVGCSLGRELAALLGVKITLEGERKMR
jgi:hypothetical protein